MKKVSRFTNVARIVETDVPVINVKAIVGDARHTLQEHSYKSADLILLADEQGHLAGVVETIKLLVISDDTPVASCRHRELPIVSPLLDQEHAAELAAKHGVPMLVIVDNESPMGVVTALTLLRVMAHGGGSHDGDDGGSVLQEFLFGIAAVL